MCVTGASIASSILRSPYVDDDRFDSLWTATRWNRGIGVFEDAIYWTNTYRVQLGRFHPLAHLVGTSTFEIFDSRTSLKIAQFVFVLLLIGLCATFVALWQRHLLAGLLFILLSPACIKIHSKFDSVIGFGLHIKVALLLFVVLLWGYLFIRSGYTRVGLTLIFLGSASSIIYYEMAVLASLATLPLSLALDERNRRRVSGVVIGGAILYVALRLFLLGSIAPGPSLGYYRPSYVPQAVATTWLKQISSVVPFSNVSEIGFHELGRQLLMPSTRQLLALFLVAAGTLVAVLTTRWNDLRKSSTEEDCLSPKYLVGVAALVLLLVAIVPALSEGHQQTTRWFAPYLNGLYQDFAVLIILSVTLSACARRLLESRSRLLAVPLMTLVLSLAGYVQVVGNESIVRLSPPWEANLHVNGFERTILAKVLADADVQLFPGYSEVWSLPPRPWMNNDYVRWLTRDRSAFYLPNSWQRFAAMPTVIPTTCRAYSEERKFDCQQSRPFVTFTRAQNYRDGYVVAARLLAGRTTAKLDLEHWLDSTESFQTTYASNQYELQLVSSKFVFTGRFVGCSTVEAKTTSGTWMKLKTIRNTESGLNIRVPIVLNAKLDGTIRADGC